MAWAGQGRRPGPGTVPVARAVEGDLIVLGQHRGDDSVEFKTRSELKRKPTRATASRVWDTQQRLETAVVTGLRPWGDGLPGAGPGVRYEASTPMRTTSSAPASRGCTAPASASSSESLISPSEK